ncbi:MAG: hypothetical protein J3R72DRAFT_524363 [Linnemannia gamsii]|nr:MAG: hypothetical protein J3R72DRAFT_524363 [Linnemannia gamsii]
MVTSFKSLILSASVAALFTLTSTTIAAPAGPVPVRRLDPCGLLGAKQAADVTYKDVAACYRAIPFNRANAATTVRTVLDLFNEFYIFRDAALIPDLPAPFSSPPTDIIKRLQTIRKTTYTSDFKFHDDIRLAVNALNDAHAYYSAKCYSNYVFVQPLMLYAPVIDGIQEVRIFHDDEQRGHEKCVVSTIEGVDALTYLRSVSDVELSSSHDAGVRLNDALSYQTFDIDTKRFGDLPGSFTLRSNLPATATTKYELQCGDSEPISLNDNWQILPQNAAEFHDVASYIENVCLSQPEDAEPDNSIPNTRDDVIMGRFHHKREEPPHIKTYVEHKKRAAALAAPSNEPPNPPQQQFPGADLISSANGTAFYQLKAKPDVGVLVFHTFDAKPETEVPHIIASLKELHKRNVSKILIDFQGNGGGYVRLAVEAVQTFFPSAEYLATTMASDLRVTRSIQALAAASFNKADTLFDGSSYINFDNGTETYIDNRLFAQPVTYTRGGRSAQYTERTTFLTALSEVDPALSTFPWTNNANNIRILTDGRCGSSCAIASYHLTSVHNVEAYAIGGDNAQELSMYSFAGGAVSKYKSIQQMYKDADVTSPLATLPYDTDIGLPILEIYAHGSSIPLEYDAALYPAKNRLAFTADNAHDREAMWAQVAASAWKSVLEYFLSCVEYSHVSGHIGVDPQGDSGATGAQFLDANDPQFQCKLITESSII